VKPGAITHVEWNGYWDTGETVLTFKRVNAEEAKFTILDHEHYKELILAAADGRQSRGAADISRKIIHELLDALPGASDAYLRIIRRIEKEKRNADV
jgi:hypothetical protein